MNKEPHTETQNKYIKTNNYNLFKSFRYAFEGIVFTIFSECNMRIHLSVSIYLVYFSIRYYSFDRVETAVMLLAIGIVIASELLNTAVEKTVDLVTDDYHHTAKIAKDAAAGAVLFSALISWLVGIIMFWDTNIIKTILKDILTHLYIWVPIIIGNLAFIIVPELKRKRDNK